MASSGRHRSKLYEVGEDPDYRFSFANERTFLAWNRTALALVAAGLAVTQLLPPFGVAGGRRVIGLPLIAIGAFVAFSSYRRWEESERAMRLGESLPPSALPRIVAFGVTIGAIVAGLLAAFEGRR